MATCKAMQNKIRVELFPINKTGGCTVNSGSCSSGLRSSPWGGGIGHKRLKGFSVNKLNASKDKIVTEAEARESL